MWGTAAGGSGQKKVGSCGLRVATPGGKVLCGTEWSRGDGRWVSCPGAREVVGTELGLHYIALHCIEGGGFLDPFVLGPANALSGPGAEHNGGLGGGKSPL